MNDSKAEEIISTLSLIAGLLAHSIGWGILGWLLIAKAILDTICSIFCAIRELRKETK